VRLTSLRAALVALTLGSVIGACADSVRASQPTTTAGAEGGLDQAAGVQARLRLDSTTMAAGASMDADLVVDNNTGGTLEVLGCRSLFGVALSSETFEPFVQWPACAQRFTLPKGESTYHLTLRATYSSCGGADRPCADDGGMPALPPGEYEARLYQSSEIAVPPAPISIRVT
jgi:hypothetical protein